MEGPLFWGAQEAVGATDMGPREVEGARAASISQGVEPTIILTEAFKSQFLDTRLQKGWCSRLLEELSEIIGLQVYTQNGVFLGNVNNLVVDVDNGAVDGIFIGETNPLLVEGSRAVSVPYRWVQSVGDIVVLRYFPKRVSLRKGSAPPPMPAAAK